MGYQYLVLGAGVGKAIAYWLLKQPDTASVRIADASYQRAKSAVKQLDPNWDTSYPGDERLGPTYLPVDKLTGGQLIAAFSPYSVIISAIPATYNPRLAELAIRAGVHFCDLGGVVSVTKDMLGLHTDAEQAEISVVPDCGLMPGLGNIILQHLIGRMKTLAPVSALIKVGSLPERPKSPSNYQRTYSVVGLEHMCYDPAPVIRDGQVCEIPPFSENYHYCVPELTEICPQFPFVEAFPSSGASLAPWRLAEQGVRKFQELTLRWPGFVDFVRRIPRRQFAETMAKLPGTDSDHPDVVFMEVSLAEMERPNRILSCRLLDRYDHESGLSAVERTTGFATASLARMIAQGSGTPGVRTSEYTLGAGDTQRYLDNLSRWLNFTWHEA